MKKFALLAALALAIAYPAGARAGILDSPVPQLGGAKTSALFSASGVVSAGGLATFFSCTSASTDTADVSVELFGDGGGAPLNDATSVAMSVPAGGTVLFATQSTPDSSFFSTQPLLSVPTVITLGSARIIATAKFVCTAFVADAYNSPPSSMTAINLLAKSKQRGD